MMTENKAVSSELASALEFDINQSAFGMMSALDAKNIVKSLIDLMKTSSLPETHPSIVAASAAVNHLEASIKETPPRHLLEAMLDVKSDELELSPDFIVSGSGPDGDNGVFVSTWSWISFENTPLDKSEDSESRMSAESIATLERLFQFYIHKSAYDEPAARQLNLGHVRHYIQKVDIEEEAHPDFEAIQKIAPVEDLYELVEQYIESFGKIEKIWPLMSPELRKTAFDSEKIDPSPKMR
jgi:hypothetical protein